MLFLELMRLRVPASIGRCLRSRASDLFRLECGQGVVEYALIMLLIAIALVTALTSYQIALSGAYAWITESIAGASS